MKIEAALSLKLLKGKGRGYFSGTTILSILGVMLGVMVPIIVLSIMAGFQEEIKEKILGLDGHITIEAPRNSKITAVSQLLTDIRKLPFITSAYASIEMQGLVQSYDSYEPIIVRGIAADAFSQDQELKQLIEITQGSRELDKPYRILVGNGFASNQFLASKDRISLLVFAAIPLSTNRTLTKSLRTLISGIFKTGFQDYDYGVIYTSLSTLQKTMEYPEDSASIINIKVNNIWETERIKKSLLEKYGKRYSILSWQEKNSSFFRALALEKTLMYLIMSFILIVAIFNVTSGQLVQVIERKKEIGILKTIGFSPRKIAVIFLFQGLFITTIGASLGAVFGTLIALDVSPLISTIEFIGNIFSYTFHLVNVLFFSASPDYVRFEIYPQDLYYLEGIPSRVSVLQSLFFVFMAVLLSVLIGIIPSIKAGKMSPVEIMRYE